MERILVIFHERFENVTIKRAHCWYFSAHEMIESFHRLEKDHSGTIDIEQAWDTLRDMKTADGKPLTEKDIEMLLKTTAGEDKVITLPKFINLMCRLRVYRSQ